MPFGGIPSRDVYIHNISSSVLGKGKPRTIYGNNPITDNIGNLAGAKLIVRSVSPHRFSSFRTLPVCIYTHVYRFIYMYVRTYILGYVRLYLCVSVSSGTLLLFTSRIRSMEFWLML